MGKKQQQREIRKQKQAEAGRKATTKRYVWMGLAALVALVLLVTIIRYFTAASPPTVTEVTAGDRIKGNPDAALTLVKFSDFQCPACRAQHNSIKQIWPAIKGSVRFVYRHFPLTNIHPHAVQAARYSEAAGKQGKFWELHDLFFERQRQWTSSKDITPVFDGYAKELGLDVARLKADADSQEVRNKVALDAQSARSARAASTPTLFLNGKLLRNVRDANNLRTAIKDALKSGG